MIFIPANRFDLSFVVACSIRIAALGNQHDIIAGGESRTDAD